MPKEASNRLATTSPLNMNIRILDDLVDSFEEGITRPMHPRFCHHTWQFRAFQTPHQMPIFPHGTLHLTWLDIVHRSSSSTGSTDSF